MLSTLINYFSPSFSGFDCNDCDSSRLSDLGKIERVSRMLFGVASADNMRSQSFGEVKKSETISYRTFKPERGGLFCGEIFGPTRNYECLCGKYKRMKYRGTICDKCGVEVTESSVRRERMGHIELKAPVAHIWFVKSLPSKLAHTLGVSVGDLEAVLYYSKYMVVDPGITKFSMCDVINEEIFSTAKKEYGHDAFCALMGAEAVKIVLEKMNFEKIRDSLIEELDSINSEVKRKKIIGRLRILNDLIKSGNSPSSMILDVIPVIPPELRPLVMLDGGRFASSDLNELYKKVINRNIRLDKLMKLNAPEIVKRNEKRMLQEAVDVLFDNGRRTRVLKNSNKRPYKSLSDMLKGKQGRFRQNLLGKRVDYSGRSVIVVGSTLKLHQFGLPKKMALELFKPFVYSKLEMYGVTTTIKMAKKAVESEIPEVWEILEGVVDSHPVLLNRAPTLHRLGIQAFEPVIIEGKAIQLHPLVCSAFNADFDGDQMAVHVPLSLEAQLEARILMMSVNNILNPANGKPMVIPTQDIVLGLYYVSLERKKLEKERIKVFSSIEGIEAAILANAVSYHTPIIYCCKKNSSFCRFNTTPGRVLIYSLMPPEAEISLTELNRVFDQKFISSIVSEIYSKCGEAVTVEFVDKLKSAGFEFATISGISFGRDDLLVPDSKKDHLAFGFNEVAKFNNQYQEGLITYREKHNKSIDVWTKCTELISRDMMSNMSKGIKNGLFNNEDSLNSVFLMIDSGARGSAAQLKQLAGMRGLMSKPSGEIIERPITSNFVDGLKVDEYFISTHGARKGLSDVALKTANSGYLTRRLVDVAQECVINCIDCKTSGYMVATSIIESCEVIVDVAESVIGRFSAADVFNPLTGEQILKAGELIDNIKAQKIRAASLDEIKIRSPVFCEAKNGICATCYGFDLSTGRVAELGESVGVIAAQSIGEPGTQLTMRTFHIGGAATRSAEVSSVNAQCDGRVVVNNVETVVNSEGIMIVMTRSCEISLYSNENKMSAKYFIPYGAQIFVVDGQNVKSGDKIANWDPYSSPIIAEKEGFAHYRDIIDSLSAEVFVDEITGVSSRVIIDWKKSQRSQTDLRPSIVLKDGDGNNVKFDNDSDALYHIPVGAFIKIQELGRVRAGDVLASIPREVSKTKDITGGLPKVIELFEARKPKECAIVSEIDGYVEFGKDCRLKRRIIIRPSDENEEPVSYLIPRSSHVIVSEGTFVSKSEPLIRGSIDPHDVLRILGLDELVKYMLHKIQKVYRLQGVTINDKHIEIILRQMTRKVVITDPCDSTLLSGETIGIDEYNELCKSIARSGKVPPKIKRVLMGVTKVGLQTDSPIAAASFQETVKVLTDAAYAGKSDDFSSLKENVIVGGRLVPAGTGYSMMQKWQEVKTFFDEEISKVD